MPWLKRVAIRFIKCCKSLFIWVIGIATTSSIKFCRAMTKLANFMRCLSKHTPSQRRTATSISYQTSWNTFIVGYQVELPIIKNCHPSLKLSNTCLDYSNRKISRKFSRTCWIIRNRIRLFISRSYSFMIWWVRKASQYRWVCINISKRCYYRIYTKS